MNINLSANLTGITTTIRRTTARETDTSRHHGGIIKGPLDPSNVMKLRKKTFYSLSIIYKLIKYLIEMNNMIKHMTKYFPMPYLHLGKYCEL